MQRKNIANYVKSELLEETIYRCGLCLARVGTNAGQFDIAHITPHAKTKDHSFENLIVLCVSCHAHYTRDINNTDC